MSWRRVLTRTVVAMLGIGLAIQLVPYGWRHPNPPITQAATWPDPESERVARVACYDCHSNETEWPAYAYVAPMSWLVRQDVELGRAELNFSEWDRDESEAHDAAEAVEDGSMPPSQYKLAHPDARLSDEEKALLIAALEQMDNGDEDNSGKD